MSIQEGRCPNCGSILQVDAKAEKGHCLFCDAVFPVSEALEIADNPAEHSFPNLPQPKYEGPSLQPQGGKGQSAPAKPKKKPKPAPPPVYIPQEPVKLPDVRLSRKVKMRILLISVVAILLIAGTVVPLIMQRNKVRQALLADLSGLASFTIDTTQDAAIRHTANNYLLLATKDSVSESEMIDFFKAFCEKRAEITGTDPDNFAKTYGRVTVKLVFADGGYEISQPASLAELEDGQAVTLLP